MKCRYESYSRGKIKQIQNGKIVKIQPFKLHLRSVHPITLIMEAKNKKNVDMWKLRKWERFCLDIWKYVVGNNCFIFFFILLFAHYNFVVVVVLVGCYCCCCCWYIYMYRLTHFQFWWVSSYVAWKINYFLYYTSKNWKFFLFPFIDDDEPNTKNKNKNLSKIYKPSWRVF